LQKVEKGSVKATSAPKHESEKKHFEDRQKDGRVREELRKKHTHLVDNMNKIRITSTTPPERWTSAKELPSRESEFMHRNDPVWEYGFYEPPLEKMPSGKIMLREAIEILRKMQEARTEGESATAAQMRQRAERELRDNVATVRVGKEKIDAVYEYFRPFERGETQKVVSRHELARLQDALQGRGDEFSFVANNHGEIKKLFHEKDKNKERNIELSVKETKELQEAIRILRSEESERLKKRLEQINE
ncbi:hypothetical protein PFISCL1PPCAC_15466, partial [Pristionchus fissidentatus]